MKYVKLIAKPNTWFKEGTECFHEDSDGKRLTIEEWNRVTDLKYSGGGIGMCGIRVCEDNPNERNMGYKPGDEREDGEWCMIDEFVVEIIEE